MHYAKSIAQIEEEFHTQQAEGLSTKEVPKRRETYGLNSLPRDTNKAGKVKIFLDQWKSPLIIILVVAGTISGFLGERIDMTIIYITALLNALIGFFQEYKANSALARLQSLVSFSSIVLRDGKKMQLPSEEIVPGDIVFLEAGDSVPADGRLVQVQQFAVNESVLTGESVPVKKSLRVVKGNVSLGERKNMVFKGTTVSEGTGIYIVTAIGAETELGKIATLVEKTSDDETPLQYQLSVLAKKISIIVIAIAVGIFFVGLLFGGGRYEILELFETAIAVAVAAVPEGLVISLTVILAIGMQFILKRNALVRKLVAAETLGSVSVICTDKTGTLTEGNMSVVSIHLATGIKEAAIFSKITKKSDYATLLHIGMVCNNAIEQERDGKMRIIGDTTETALLKAGKQAGFIYKQVQEESARIAEVPFSSTYKFMATLNREQKNTTLYVKGAPEVILQKATHYLVDGKEKKLTNKQQKFFMAKANELAEQGFRTLALGYKQFDTAQKNINKKDVTHIVFAGVVAIADPVRFDVKDTLQKARQAGIRVVMITGDHAKTAKAIGEHLGLIGEDDMVCEGSEIETLSELELQKKVMQTYVFARVAPEHKIRIVRAFQALGEVVSMTGDGVNDAPAIKGADIGVAVGSGTDVAKETADMVLLDDSFSTIVAAVEEGRGVYQNIKKVVLYLLSGSFAEVVMITGSIIAGFPVAALPAQILWVNIIEDAFPTMALAFEKGDKENMKDSPRKKSEPLIDKEMKTMIVIKTIVANVLLFSIFVYFYKTTGDIVLTRTIVFVGFAIDALFYIFSIRSLRHMIWQMNPFQNMYLVAAVVFGWIMLILAIYWSPLQLLLRTVPLSSFHWIIMVCFGVVNLVLIEIIKGIFIVRNIHKKTIFKRT
jgi:P-type Ca2+ transporter type 2C